MYYWNQNTPNTTFDSFLACHNSMPETGGTILYGTSRHGINGELCAVIGKRYRVISGVLEGCKNPANQPTRAGRALLRKTAQQNSYRRTNTPIIIIGGYVPPTLCGREYYKSPGGWRYLPSTMCVVVGLHSQSLLTAICA
jgi:hypothetical protein